MRSNVLLCVGNQHYCHGLCVLRRVFSMPEMRRYDCAFLQQQELPRQDFRV